MDGNNVSKTVEVMAHRGVLKASTVGKIESTDDEDADNINSDAPDKATFSKNKIGRAHVSVIMKSNGLHPAINSLTNGLNKVYYKQNFSSRMPTEKQVSYQHTL